MLQVFFSRRWNGMLGVCALRHLGEDLCAENGGPIWRPRSRSAGGRELRLRAESGPKGIASGRTGICAEAEVATRLMIECLRRKAKAPESPVVCFCQHRHYFILRFKHGRGTLTGTKVAQRGRIWIAPCEDCTAFRVARSWRQASRVASR